MHGKVAFFTDCALNVFAGGMVGAVSVEENQAYQLSMMVTGLIAVISALKVFGPERIVFLRESSAGISSSAYFCGKCFAHLVQIAITPIFYLGLFYRTAYPSIAFWEMYKVLLFTQFSCSGLGYLISVTAQPKNMQIVGVISGLIAVLLSGINPTARALDGFLPGKIGLAMSYGPWCMGGLLVKQTLGVVKALYPSYCGELNNLGYINIDNSTLTNEENILESRLLLETRYHEDLKHLMIQYFSYGAAAYLIMKFKSMNVAGLLGLGSLRYLCQVEILEPFQNFIATGKCVREELTPREFVANERKRAKTKADKVASKKSGNGNSGNSQSSSTREA